MLPDDIDAVTASYHRCMSSERVMDTFYDQFLAKSPVVAEKFRHTDFAHQKLMLRQSLLMMVLFNHQPEDVREDLERLGERHSRRGVDIPPHLYDLWLDALCETVELHDPEFEPRILDLWREAMRPGIELLVSKY